MDDFKKYNRVVQTTKQLETKSSKKILEIDYLKY